tara:strand:+ start:1056 stop:4172 length:3117 start_codon:yes stop_codon:yes gene_type:complete
MANFNIYKASAGSGKTYTLVKEYIKQGLISNGRILHKSLLAITFTNKAASEMKTRIVDALFHFKSGPNIQNESFKTLYSDLKIELKYTDSQLVEKSTKFLSDIIHHYGYFSVSTIDKFIHKIIRGFTYELDLPSNFEVEMDSDKMINDGVSSLLDEIGLNKILTKNLITYSKHKINEDKHWDIHDDLFKISKQLFKDHTSSFINNLPETTIIQNTQRELLLKIKHFEGQVEQIKSSIKQVISGIPEQAFLYKDLPRYLNKKLKKPYLDITISNRLLESIKKKTWYKKSETDAHKKQIDNVSELLCSNLHELIQLIELDYSYYLFYRTCYSSFFLTSVLSKLGKKINNIKKENSIVHISEFNQIIHRFLRESPAPFIYEKIGNRYAHYFIDEFQDTSKTQWRNLIPLVEEALATGGTCLIVGDGKQAIYRWRGGEVSQFLQLCSSVEPHELMHFDINVDSLNTNYRSGKNIVDFNNAFFSFLSQNFIDPYRRLYKNLTQNAHYKEEGYIDISILETKGEETLNETLQLLYQQILLIEKDNYNFSDVVILTRNNKEITKIATYLTERGVPIISSESLLLSNSPTIQFILDNFSVILDEKNFLAKAKLLTYLISNNIIRADSPHEIIANFSNSDNLQFQSFLNEMGLQWDIEHLKRLNIYELAEVLIRLFGLDKAPNIYITFFLDFIFDFSIKKNPSINDFLDYWMQKQASVSIIIPPGINAIEIMTIHKSKGLQFPIVLFPFANWKEDLGIEKKWFNLSSVFKKQSIDKNIATLLPLKKELEKWPKPFPESYLKHKSDSLLDNINLLYVAMTRPKERLYIISNSDPRKGGIYKYFRDFLTQTKTSNIHKSTFVFGKKHIKKSEIKTQDIIENFDFISSAWRHRIRIRDTRQFNKNLNQKYSIIWGELIHEIMSGVNEESDIEIMLNKLNVINKHGLQAHQRITKEIKKIINRQEIKHLFQSNLEVFSETSILNVDGVIYRPDRVVIHAKNEVSLIDYKTGKKKKSDIDQLKIYENILLKSGYNKIHKYLIYLTTEEIYQL